MPSKLRLALLGTGVAATDLYLPAFQKLTGRIALVACANRTRKKAERFARLAGIPQVVDSAEELFALPEVDAVLISLPIAAQPPMVLAALAAGKAVLSEKPVAESVARARKLVKAAKRYDAPWLVAENFAFMPAVARLRSWLAAGRLGEVRFFEARQTSQMDAKNPFFRTPWRHAPDFLGGFVVDGGVHLAHAVRACFGTPSTVLSRSAHGDPRLPPPDTAVATLQFPSGVLGTWVSCFSTVCNGPLLRVAGSRGEAELHWGHAVLRDAKGKETRFAAPRDSFELEFEHFADVVKKGKPPAYTPEDALADLELIERVASGGTHR